MVSARADAGTAIEYKKFQTEQDEAEDTLALAARDPQNSAVLARTNRGLAHVENLAIQKNIRYHLLGKSGFWHQTEIHKGVEALKKHMNLSLPAAVAMAWHQLDAHYRGEDVTKEDNDAYENLQILREMTKKFDTVRDFVMYATRCMHVKRTQRGVALGTCHAAKGLEWTNVFLIGCREGMMPHNKSLDPAEERRIFFVAISRPIDRLRISWTGAASPFVRPDLSAEMAERLELGMKNVERIPLN
jgi:DNA helicase-2/ATP-dependent DNA helicase PcrA